MFSVTFWFLAFGQGGWGAFRREVKMPFAPAAGLYVEIPGQEGDVWQVQRVSWAGGRRLVCRLDDEAAPDEDFEDLVEYYTGRGWALEGDAGDGEEPDGDGEEPPPPPPPPRGRGGRRR